MIPSKRHPLIVKSPKYRGVTQVQKDWIKMLESFLRTNPPRFHRENDAMVAQRWKHNVKNRAMILGADLVQMYRLASFTLEGNTGMCNLVG